MGKGCRPPETSRSQCLKPVSKAPPREEGLCRHDEVKDPKMRGPGSFRGALCAITRETEGRLTQQDAGRGRSWTQQHMDPHSPRGARGHTVCHPTCHVLQRCSLMTTFASSQKHEDGFT